MLSKYFSVFFCLSEVDAICVLIVANFQMFHAPNALYAANDVHTSLSAEDLQSDSVDK